MTEENNQKFEKAKDCMKNGNFHNAVGILKSIYNTEKDLDVRLLTADALVLIGNKDSRIEAMQIYTELLDTTKKFFGYIGLARLSCRSKKYDIASEYIEKAKKINTEDYQLMILQGEIELNKNNKDKAKEYFIKAIELEKNSYNSLLRLAEFEVSMGNLDEAIEYYNQVPDTIPVFREQALYGLGKIAVEKNDDENIVFYLSKLLNSKYREDSLYILANVELKRNIDKAKEYFLKLLNSKYRKEVIFELGKIERKQGNKEQAKRYFKKLYSDVPELQKLGKKCIKEKNYEKAKYFFEKAHIIMPFDTYVTFDLGKLAFDSNNKEEAKKWFEEILDINPEDSLTIAYLGLIKEEEKSINVARIYYEKAIKLNPNNYLASTRLGGIKLDEGDRKGARKDLTRALRNKPDFYKASLSLGIVETMEYNYEKGRECLEKILESPLKIPAMYSLGILERKEGNFEQSEYYFNEILKIMHDENVNAIGKIRYVLVILELAKLEIVRKNYEKARNYINEYLESVIDYDDKYLGITQLIYLNIKEENYLEAYELFNTDYKDYLLIKKGIKNHDIEKYLNYKLNPESSKNYNYSRLFDHEDKTIENAKKYIYTGDNEDLSFVNDIDLQEVLNIIKQKIKVLDPIDISTTDSYLVNCDMDVSYFDGKYSKYVIASTLPNSDNIFEILPAIVSNKVNERKKQKELEYKNTNN